MLETQCVQVFLYLQWKPTVEERDGLQNATQSRDFVAFTTTSFSPNLTCQNRHLSNFLGAAENHFVQIK